MTRFILFSALGSLLILGNSALCEPQPDSPQDLKNKRYKRHINRAIVEGSTHSSPTPTPGARPSQIRGLVGEVGGAPTTSSRRGPGQDVPAAHGSRTYVPNESYEAEAPGVGPVFKNTGAPPASLKTKPSGSNTTSTAARKTPSKVLIPPLRKSGQESGEETSGPLDIDANPPEPSELGAVVIPMIPRYDAVPRSKPLYLPEGNAPIPVDYTRPGSEASAQISPTSLRAWNGEMTRETRTFDQTRVQVTPGPDEARRWQFFWRTKDAKPRAARWEISSVPFVDDGKAFPPPGLVAYGDASVSAPSPTMENFFAVEFNLLAKHFDDEAMPNRLYLRVVPVDGSGHPAAQPSNWVRIDLP